MALFVLRNGYRVTTTPKGGVVTHVRTGDELPLTAIEVQVLARATAGGVDSEEASLQPVFKKLANLGLLVRSGSPAHTPLHGLKAARPASLDLTEQPSVIEFLGPPPRLGPLPRFRADLAITRASDQGFHHVEDPVTGKHLALHDFEVSLARMLNGERTTAEVVEAASRLGIPVDGASLGQFVSQLEAAGFVEAPGAPQSPGEPQRPPRRAWAPELRELFQQGLKATREGRYADGEALFGQVLDADPGNEEAAERLAEVRRLAAAAPAPVPAQPTPVPELEPIPEAVIEEVPVAAPSQQEQELVHALTHAAPQVDDEGPGVTELTPLEEVAPARASAPTTPYATVTVDVEDMPASAPRPAALEPGPVAEGWVMTAPVEVAPMPADASGGEAVPDAMAALFAPVEAPSPEAPETKAAPVAPDVTAPVGAPQVAAATSPEVVPAAGPSWGVLGSIYAASVAAALGVGYAIGVSQGHAPQPPPPPVVATTKAPVPAPPPVDPRPVAVKPPETPVPTPAPVVDAGAPAVVAAPPPVEDAGAPAVAPVPVAVVDAGAAAPTVALAAQPAVTPEPAAGAWTTAKILKRGRVTMGTVQAAGEGVVAWSVAAQASVKKNAPLGTVGAEKLVAPKAGLLIPVAAEGATVKAGDLLANVVYVEGFIQATVALPEAKAWDCEVTDTASGQKAPCKVVTATPKGGVLSLTATTEPLWFDACAAPELKVAPKAE